MASMKRTCGVCGRVMATATVVVGIEYCANQDCPGSPLHSGPLVSEPGPAPAAKKETGEEVFSFPGHPAHLFDPTSHVWVPWDAPCQAGDFPRLRDGTLMYPVPSASRRRPYAVCLSGIDGRACGWRVPRDRWSEYSVTSGRVVHCELMAFEPERKPPGVESGTGLREWPREYMGQYAPTLQERMLAEKDAAIEALNKDMAAAGRVFVHKGTPMPFDQHDHRGSFAGLIVEVSPRTVSVDREKGIVTVSDELRPTLRGILMPSDGLLHLDDGRDTPACRAKPDKAPKENLRTLDELCSDESKSWTLCERCELIVAMRIDEGRFRALGPSAACAAPDPRPRLTICVQREDEP